MAKTKIGVVGCGGRMGRMLVAEIAATKGCTIAGGSEAPGSGYVNQDIGEIAGLGRIGARPQHAAQGIAIASGRRLDHQGWQAGVAGRQAIHAGVSGR